MRWSRLFLLGLVFVSLLAAALEWNSAPGRVPSHFDAAGHPNAWSSRDAFFALQVAVTLGVAVLFMGITWLVNLTPAGLINLPNKSYWLAASRRQDTMETLASHFDVFAAATILFLTVVFGLSSAASRSGTLATSYFLPALVLYLVFTIGWTVKLIRTFVHVPAER